MPIQAIARAAQSEIRRSNLSNLLFEIHLRGPQTRSQLASKLRVNRSTVASLIAELSDRSFVWEHRPERNGAQATPGRPSPVVEICHDGPAAIAVELSTDWIGAAVIGLGGWVATSASKELSLASSSPQEAVEQAHDLVSRLLLGLEPRPRIVAMGVSAPGPVKADEGFLLDAPNLGWKDVSLGDLFRARFAELGVPVMVSNDAELAALAEHLRGSGRGTSDFICLWGEAGIGAGIVADGRSLRGAAGYAGEVGHLPVDPAGLECHCGSRGCWETQVGEAALLRRAGRDPSGGSAAVAGLLADAGSGDENALEAMAETGRWLGIGIAGLINAFNPSRIALGGLYARVYPFAQPSLVREVDLRAMRAPRAMVEVTTASLGANALLIGAAEFALAPILNDPTIVALSDDTDRNRFSRRPNSSSTPERETAGTRR